MDKTYMVYSLFYCSLLLALFPLLGSSNPRSSLHHHLLFSALLHVLCYLSTHCRLFQPSLLTAPPHASRSSLTLRRLFQYSLLAIFPRSAGSFNPRSSSHHHTLLAALPCSAGSFKSRSSSHHHTLLVTQSHAPRHPPTLQNPLQHPLFCNPKYHGRRCEIA